MALVKLGEDRDLFLGQSSRDRLGRSTAMYVGRVRAAEFGLLSSLETDGRPEYASNEDMMMAMYYDAAGAHSQECVWG